MNIEGEHGLPLNVFRLAAQNILSLSSLVSSINFGRSYASDNFAMSCNFYSSSTGLIKVKQSLSLKKAVNYLRILFFRIANSELPF
jgi:hypothetical protein